MRVVESGIEFPGMARIKAKLIIFDLDGTLVDSKRDIAFSVNETLSRIGHPPLSDELIYEYVGHGVRPLIERAVTATGGGDLQTAIKIFQEIYTEHLLDTTVMFDGMDDVLRHFSDKTLAVATNKPYGYSVKILEGLKILDKFVSVKGGDSMVEKKPHPMMLEAIMAEAGRGPGDSVIIGDSSVDVQTGKNAGIKTVGVTYGFRPAAEIFESSPDAVAATVAEIKSLIE